MPLKRCDEERFLVSRSASREGLRMTGEAGLQVAVQAEAHQIEGRAAAKVLLNDPEMWTFQVGTVVPRDVGAIALCREENSNSA